MSMVVFISVAIVVIFCTIALALHFTRKGVQGQPGATGATGSAGPASGKGPVGDTGDRGPDGPAGSTGPDGPTGNSGSYTASSGVYQPSSTLKWNPTSSDTDITVFLSKQDTSKSYNLIIDQGSGNKRTFNLSRSDFMTEGYSFTICNASKEQSGDGSFYIVPSVTDPWKDAVVGCWDNPPDCSAIKYANMPYRVTVPLNGCIMVLVTKGTECPTNDTCSNGTTSCVARTFWYLNFITSQNTIERKCGTYNDSNGVQIPCP